MAYIYLFTGEDTYYAGSPEEVKDVLYCVTPLTEEQKSEILADIEAEICYESGVEDEVGDNGIEFCPSDYANATCYEVSEFNFDDLEFEFGEAFVDAYNNAVNEY